MPSLHIHTHLSYRWNWKKMAGHTWKCFGVQNIGLTINLIRLKCPIWKCTPVPDRWTNITATAWWFLLTNARHTKSNRSAHDCSIWWQMKAFCLSVLTSSCLRRRITSFCRLSASRDLICESLMRCSLRSWINSWLCFNSACRPLSVSSRILLISWTCKYNWSHYTAVFIFSFIGS